MTAHFRAAPVATQTSTSTPCWHVQSFINQCATDSFRYQIEMKTVGKEVEPSKQKSNAEWDPQDDRVLIIYTGGTMGMMPTDDSGLAPVPGYFTSQVLAMQEMANPQMPCYDIIEYDELLDSACMGPKDWIAMAEDIEHNYYDYSGFVVCTGTDTMAYAASALSFMLINLHKPVVFTGSQVPFCDVQNDARRNLIVSMLFAASRAFTEVTIFFSDRLMRGCRSTKASSFSLAAFTSPNYPPLALVGVNITLRVDLFQDPPKSSFRVWKQMNSHIIIIKLAPGFDDDALFAIVNHTKTLRAIVLSIYGTGNAPSSRTGLVDAVRLATQRGIIVVALTQCFQGGVLLDKYQVGAYLKKAGVVSGGDMTAEACVTKLAFLLGKLTDIDKIKELLSVNLRGEVSPPQKFQHGVHQVRLLMDRANHAKL